MELKIAAKVDRVDQDYFDAVIRPLLAGPRIEFIGEVGESEKQQFLGGARALLFPIDWPEPFGLVMIEAMACGTPVIAWRHGSVPEVIEEGRTGFIVETIGEAVAAIERIDSLDRWGVRHRFEQRFTAERMARDYVRIYESLAMPGEILLDSRHLVPLESVVDHARSSGDALLDEVPLRSNTPPGAEGVFQ